MVNRKLKMSIAKEEGLLLKKDEDKDKGGQQYQSQFNLLQLNDDCLLLLFTQKTFLQAFKLGFTCRRLYGLYRDSLAKRRSLLIYRQDSLAERRSLLIYNDEFVKKKNLLPLFDQSPAEAADSLPHLFPEVDHLRIPKYEPSVICHLLTCMTDLVSLEIRNVEANEFCQMVATLNRSQAKLQSFKLEVAGYPREKMEPLKLELPSLKHLSLCVNSSSGQFFLCNPIFLTVMPQLTSFQLFIEENCYTPTVLPFIRKHVYPNAHLVAAARSGSANLNVNLKIKFFWNEGDSDSMSGLELITSLEAVQFEDVMTEPFIRRLSLMRNLKRLIILPLTHEGFDSPSALPYQQLFNALVNNPRLEVLELDFCGDQWFSEPWHGRFQKADFPVLPTVRSFSLLYRTFKEDDNPLDVFQLEYIFPGLTELNLTFVQKERSVYDRFNGGLMPLEHNFSGLKEVSVAYKLK